MTNVQRLAAALAEYNPSLPDSTTHLFALLVIAMNDNFNDVQTQFDEALGRIRYLEGEVHRLTGQKPPASANGPCAGHVGTGGFGIEI